MDGVCCVHGMDRLVWSITDSANLATYNLVVQISLYLALSSVFYFFACAHYNCPLCFFFLCVHNCQEIESYWQNLDRATAITSH